MLHTDISTLNNANSLEDIITLIHNIKSCKIALNATNAVIGQGMFVAPKMMVIGEAPGEQEDLTGIPFCGRSGKLLNQMLMECGLTRSQNIFVTNSVFWRPPNNRKPTTDEIQLCRSYLNRLIELSNPRFLLLVGATAFEAIFDKPCIFREYRGKIFSYRSIPTGVIYHPSYLLRQPSQIHSTKLDIQSFQDHIR